MSVSPYRHAALYDRLNIGLDNLGVVTLTLTPPEIPGSLPRDNLEPQRPQPLDGSLRLILLHGLLPGVSALEVQEVLTGWENPEKVQVKDVFTSRMRGVDRLVMVLDLKNTPQLHDAYERLSLLPHIDMNRFNGELTLAYVKENADTWAWEFSEQARAGMFLEVDTSLDKRGLLGLVPEERSTAETALPGGGNVPG